MHRLSELVAPKSILSAATIKEMFCIVSQTAAKHWHIISVGKRHMLTPAIDSRGWGGEQICHIEKHSRTLEQIVIYL